MKTTGVKENIIGKAGKFTKVGLMERTIFPVEIQTAEL